ncbi:hypothetical protein SAMN05660337_2738 [Maridesulfovibrio ferrireducens]|uniref:SAP domain-containing protein n=1 Tax=Maridesulfovibrio ferrireducens TaxID=246191 RepID=A0A1G9JD31_9BACT|nr:hypothetical protein [Maridesulfovibrio ferrireducens]SDL35116.1 hypothetical protein SAMN05660337_2738 [Maridesulfovibrio ferrireducens]
MSQELIADLAERLSVNVEGLSLIESVRMLQRVEGNFDCFARAASGFCDQKDCLFYIECLQNSRKSKD